MTREAFAPDLLGAPTLPDGMDDLDPIGVDHPEHGRSGQEGSCPVLMRLEEAEESGALGAPGKPGPIVARQPPIQRPVASAFEGMEHPFQSLADVPPEIEWFANPTSANTRRCCITRCGA